MNNFCVALFNAIRKDNNLNIRPCCIFDSKELINDVSQYMNSEYMADVRNRMLTNEQVPECKKCWDKEKYGLPSLRHIYNQQFLRNNEVPDKLVKKVFHSNKIIHADIKIGNTCNFACAMCHPGDSSLIYNKYKKNLNNEFVMEYTNDFGDYMNDGANISFRNQSLLALEEVIKLDSIVSLKLLGGEPLLEHKFLEKLKDIPSYRKKKIVLYLVTNGSVDLVQTLTDLGDFKHIYVTISLEGIGKVQEYVRKKSNWQQIEENIHRFLEFNKPNWFIGIHHTLQALSLHGFPDLIKWCNKLNIRLTVQALTHPKYLSMAVLDYDYRSNCLSDMNKIHNTPVEFNNLENDDIKFEDIMGYCMSYTYDYNLVNKLIRYIEFYESDHHLKLNDISPKLLNLLMEKNSK